ENGVYTAGRFLHAKDIGRKTKHDQWKPAVWNEQTNAFAIPQGTMGSRWDGQQKWNLHMIDEETGEPIEPRLSVLGIEDEIGTVRIPYFSNDGNKVLERDLPIKKLDLNGEEVCVTTVFDLILANYGVNRGIGDQSAASYDDPEPFTPGWQEQMTGIKKEGVIKIAREFAQNAIDTDGRSMIIVGAGINHWFNSDTIYRAVLNLVLLVGAQGVNGGGWA
ncbi:molybdopterin-dependent oxidoreductase, partial [Bacillus vallismortis]